MFIIRATNFENCISPFTFSNLSDRDLTLLKTKRSKSATQFQIPFETETRSHKKPSSVESSFETEAEISDFFVHEYNNCSTFYIFE